MKGERLADEVIRLVSEGMDVQSVARRVCVSVPRIERILERARKRGGTKDGGGEG